MDENMGDPDFSIMALFGRGGYCRPIIPDPPLSETEDDSIMCPEAGR
jgi:hypothetical protein